jgi:hypothetical protein
MKSIGLAAWIQAGAQLAFCRPLGAVREARITAWQFLALMLITLAIDIAATRLMVSGPARFYSISLLVLWAPFALSALLIWLGFSHSPGIPPRVGTALGLQLAGGLFVIVIVYAIFIAAEHAQGSRWFAALAWASSIAYVLGVVWTAVIALRIYHLLSMAVRPALAVALAAACVSVGSSWFYNYQLWYPSADESAQDSQPEMRLDQALFNSQTQLLQTQLQALAPERAGVHDVYTLIYAPYAPEDVFLKEANMVQAVMQARFGAQGRVISLVNNVQTTATHAWATPMNLERSIAAIAQQMNHEEDMLLVYLTSHGAQDFKLESQHWPLSTDPLTPTALAAMLDKAGIQHRILSISACYSGGWVEPLKNDRTLVMTAADATHTSYGCGSRSELTFFGRAVFNEALRETHSFEEAFKRAVPIIKRREDEAGKEDGFSNPQIAVGSAIAPLLAKLVAQQGAPQAAPPGVK